MALPLSAAGGAAEGADVGSAAGNSENEDVFGQRVGDVAASAPQVACRGEALEAGFHACLTTPLDAATLVDAFVLALVAEQV